MNATMCRFEKVGSDQRLVVRQAHTMHSDQDAAVGDLCEQLDTSAASAVLLFCSSSYDLTKLARQIATRFAGRVVACTTPCQFGEGGYRDHGITGVSLRSSQLRMTPYLIAPLAECQARASDAAFAAMSGMLEHGSERAFGLVVVDGASRAEERLAASLYQSLGTIPLIGGSLSGDSAEHTYVYYQGEFLKDAAVLALFETTLPFATFKVSHAEPGRHKLVVTAADPEQRVVLEFNGEPAAEAYAEAIGVDIDELDAGLFASNSLLLQSGTEHFVRTVQRRNADDSLSLYCALEEGLVLTVGSARDPSAALRRGLGEVQTKIGRPEFILGCDGALRCVEAQSDDPLGKLLAENQFVGFSGSAAQYNAIYVNQTLSAVALSSG